MSEKKESFDFKELKKVVWEILKEKDGHITPNDLNREVEKRMGLETGTLDDWNKNMVVMHICMDYMQAQSAVPRSDVKKTQAEKEKNEKMQKRTCSNCKKSGTGFPKCSGCKRVYYCSLMQGNIRMMKNLIQEHGSEVVHVVNELGNTALLLAAGYGNFEAVKLLFQNGADLNTVKKNADEFTAIMMAAQGGDVRITKLFLQKGVDVNYVTTTKRWTALLVASQSGHTDVAKVLAQNGADVNHKERNEQTALHKTAFYGHADVAKVLIDNGADVNAGDIEKWTPLHTVAYKGHADVAKVLIDNGADVDLKNQEGLIALMIASLHGKGNIVELLRDFCGITTTTEQKFKKSGDD
eukprot:g5036.t1